MDVKRSPFFAEANLMVQTLPCVLEEKCFALKGGSAINLFFRNMPRLSVDIDLIYLPIEAREVSLSNIAMALDRIAQSLKKRLMNTKVQKVQLKAPNVVSKLLVRQGDVQIKIEPNLVTRGTIFPCEEHTLCAKAQDVFEMFVSARTASLADVFGGKICAALDRQHPRDLFDVKFLLDNEGLTDQIRKAFIVYLISHDRAIGEVLNPVFKHFKQIYDGEFQGMTLEPVGYQELVDTRARLVDIIKSNITQDEKQFLLSFKEGNPRWNLISMPEIEKLPAVRWKLMNIQKMEESKRQDYLKRLRVVLNL